MRRAIGLWLGAQIKWALGWAIPIAIPVVLLTLGANRVIDRATRADWLTYVRGADAILSGASPYGRFQIDRTFLLPEAAEGLGYVYPPSAAVVMAPFLRPFELWAVLSLLLFISGLLAVLWRHRMLTPAPVVVVLLFACISPPLWDGVSGGAASIPLAGMFGLTYAAVPLGGVGAAMKLFPASWILLDLSRRTIGWTALGVAAPALLSIAVAGAGPWIDYAAVLQNMRPDCERLLPSGPCIGIPAWMTYALGLLIVGVASQGPRPWLLLALGVLPLVITPQVTLHYLATAAPGVVAVFARWRTLSAGWHPQVAPARKPSGR